MSTWYRPRSARVEFHDWELAWSYPGEKKTRLSKVCLESLYLGVPHYSVQVKMAERVQQGRWMKHG